MKAAGVTVSGASKAIRLFALRGQRIVMSGVLAAAAICLGPGCARDGYHYQGERISILPWSLRHGHGTLTEPDGGSYVGQWYKGKRHGWGTYTWPNGTKYEGQWENDMKQGKGSYTWPDGATLEGIWENDKFKRRALASD